jgi:hypothetical protein
VAVPDDPLETIRTLNVEDGVRIDERTATPLWLGERLDVGYAIDVLHPRAG